MSDCVNQRVSPLLSPVDGDNTCWHELRVRQQIVCDLLQDFILTGAAGPGDRTRNRGGSHPAHRHPCPPVDYTVQLPRISVGLGRLLIPVDEIGQLFAVFCPDGFVVAKRRR